MKMKNVSGYKAGPKGFLFSSVEAAIKKLGRKDITLIYSEKEATMSGVFTTNKVKAAPVRIDMNRILSGRGQAIIANSGNANACSGKQGLKDAREMAKLVAKELKLSQGSVYVCSTGVIGMPMPMDRVRAKIPELVAGLGQGTLSDAAVAIMTTDTFPKIVSRNVKAGGRQGTVTGICKGAGMICPNLATMLCFLMTDLAVERRALAGALKWAVENSFNRITVDGDMSTNDTVLLMANGLAGNEMIRRGSASFAAFSSALSSVAEELSSLIVKDGEGASKFITIVVRNAKSRKDATEAAFAIARSTLVKTAIYGNDANWGRIMAALGYSGVSINEGKTDIYFDKVKVASNGISTGRDKEATTILKQKEIKIVVDLHVGSASSKILTCDLTEEYVRINAEYRT